MRRPQLPAKGLPKHGRKHRRSSRFGAAIEASLYDPWKIWTIKSLVLGIFSFFGCLVFGSPHVKLFLVFWGSFTTSLLTTSVKKVSFVDFVDTYRHYDARQIENAEPNREWQRDSRSSGKLNKANSWMNRSKFFRYGKQKYFSNIKTKNIYDLQALNSVWYCTKYSFDYRSNH